MRDSDFRPELLDELLSLPEDDPRRIEAERSPRWRALLASYRAFVDDAAPMPEGARLEDARVRLTAFLERQVEGVETPAGESLHRPVDSRSDNGGLADRLREFFTGLTPRPAMGVAMALLVLGAVVVWQLPPPGQDDPPMLRSGDGIVGTGFTVSPARSLGGDRWELTWSPVEGADAYVVVLYGTDLSELARSEMIDSARLVVGSEGIDGVSLPRATYWRVEALREGEELSKSSVGIVSRP